MEKKFKEVTDNKPDFSTKEGIRKFNEFCKLAEIYPVEKLKKIFAAKDAIETIMKDFETSYFHYKIEEVSAEVLTSHLESINEGFGIDPPGYWRKAMLKQATEFLQDFSKSEARFWLHKLEDFNFGSYEFEGVISFKFIRNWIERMENVN